MGSGAYLVTGATGVVGSALCRALIGRGGDVVGVVRDLEGVPAELRVSGRFRAVELDMSGYAALASRVDVPVDTVFHLAWRSPWGEGFSDWRTQLANVEAACVLAGQAKKMGAGRLVFSGTYNQCEAVELACARRACPRPTTVYSAAKLAADLLLKTLCAQTGVECLSGLIAMAYGPGDRSSKLTNTVMKHLLAGEAPRLIPEDVPYDCIFIDDVVWAFLAIADDGVPGTANYVGHEKIRTVGWWMRAFRDAITPETELRFGTYPYAGGVDFSRVDTGRLHRDTAFSCDPDIARGVRVTAGILKAAGGRSESRRIGLHAWSGSERPRVRRRVPRHG